MAEARVVKDRAAKARVAATTEDAPSPCDLVTEPCKRRDLVSRRSRWKGGFCIGRESLIPLRRQRVAGLVRPGLFRLSAKVTGNAEMHGRGAKNAPGGGIFPLIKTYS